MTEQAPPPSDLSPSTTPPAGPSPSGLLVNPLLGVLNLIDSTVSWPRQLDTKAIRVLHLHAGRMLTQARRIMQELPAHKLDAPYGSMPGITAELVLMRHIATGSRHAQRLCSARNMWLRRPQDPRLADALESAIIAGLAWRAAEIGSLAKAPTTLLWYALEWDDILDHAARWGAAAARASEPDLHEFGTLLSCTGWYCPGFRSADPATWCWTKPRLDDAARADSLRITLPGPDGGDPVIYTLNGTAMGWSQLCEAMTSGRALPRSANVTS